MKHLHRIVQKVYSRSGKASFAGVLVLLFLIALGTWCLAKGGTLGSKAEQIAEAIPELCSDAITGESVSRNLLAESPEVSTDSETEQESTVQAVIETMQTATEDEIRSQLTATLDRGETYAILGTSDIDLVNEIVSELRDEPEYFWLGETIHISSERRGSCTVDFGCTYSDLEKRRMELQQVVDQFLAAVPVDADDYTKVLFLHDFLVEWITYDVTLENGTLYDALVNRCCVCAGYAKAFLYLGELMGLETAYYSGIGTTEDGSDAHAWNSVVMDGELYYCDVTWDDPIGGGLGITSHEWFGVTYDDFIGTHSPDESYPMEYTNATACNYFYRNGLVMETADKDALHRMLQLSGDVLEIYCPSEEIYLYLKSSITNTNGFYYDMQVAGRGSSSWRYSCNDSRRTVILLF